MGFKNRSETESQVRNALIAGSISGMVTKTLAAPIDRIKIYYQVRNKPFSFSEGMSVAKKIIKKRGIHSMWRGNSASLIRVVPYAAIQFTVHEQLKSIFDIRTYEQKLKKPGLCLTAGALAGLTAISCTYPLDVCRARMITDHTYKNVWEVMKRAFTSKDHKYGLYRGFMPAVIAIVPYTGVSFFVYELFKTRYFAQAKYSNDRLMLAIQNIILGSAVSFLGQTIIYPLEVIRRRQQTDVTSDKNFQKILREIYKKNGFRGYYNGITLSWLKLPIIIGCSMVSFDLVFSQLNKYL